MSLTRRQFSRALLVPALLTGAATLAGCGGADPDQTGSADTGIGAPGHPPDTPPPSEDEAYQLQLKRDQEIMKQSQQ